MLEYRLTILYNETRYSTSLEFDWFPCVEVIPICGGVAVLPLPRLLGSMER